MLVFVVLLLGLCVAWIIGANSMSTLVGPSVSSGALKLKEAIALASLLAILGAVLFGGGVMETVGSKIVPPGYVTPLGAIAAMCSAVLWVGFCTWRGIPTGITHSIIGAIVGFGLATNVITEWSVLKSIVLSWFVSPAVGLALAFLIYYLISIEFFRNVKSLNERNRLEYIFMYLQIFATCYITFAIGSNSIGTAIGIASTVFPDYLLLKVLGGLALTAGVIILGPRMIKTAGYVISDLTPSRGFSAQFAAASTILAFTFLKIPISPTQILVGAVVGVGLARGINSLQIHAMREIAISWVLSAPVSLLLCAVIYKFIVFSILILI